MLRKAKNKKNGNHPTILARWKAQESYRRSLAEHNIGEKEIMLYDQLALENHHYTAAKAERIQNSKHWVLSVNAEGPQPQQQRSNYVAAKRECQRQEDEYMAETKQFYKPIHPSKHVVDRKTGWKWCKEQQGNPPHTLSSSSSSWQNSSWQNWK